MMIDQPICEDEMQEALLELFEQVDQEGEIEVVTFADAGVLTQNRGLVVRTREGAEFQLTIVQSR